MSDAVDIVLDARAQLGEGPIWDPDSGEVVWVDIIDGVIHRTDPRTGSDTTLSVGRPVGSVALRRGGGLVLATDDGFRLLDPGATETRLLAPVEADDALTRMNDGKVDPAGRFWAGTMARDEGPGLGTLYRLDADGTATAVVTPIGDLERARLVRRRRDDVLHRHPRPVGRHVPLGRRDRGPLGSAGPHPVRPPGRRRPRRSDPRRRGLSLGRPLGWLVHPPLRAGRLVRPRDPLPRRPHHEHDLRRSDLRGPLRHERLEGPPGRRSRAQPHAGSLFHVRPGVAGRPLWRYEG